MSRNTHASSSSPKQFTVSAKQATAKSVLTLLHSSDMDTPAKSNFADLLQKEITRWEDERKKQMDDEIKAQMEILRQGLEELKADVHYIKAKLNMP